MQDFRNSKSWQKAHELTLLVYQLTIDFPQSEVFGLRTQIRRTCVDIPAKIAEGCGSPNDTEFIRNLQTAFAYTCRLEYYFLLANDLDMLKEDSFQQLTNELIEVKKMLSSFISKLKTKN